MKGSKKSGVGLYMITDTVKHKKRTCQEQQRIETTGFRKRSLGNQKVPSFWILQFMRSHSLDLSSMGQPCVHNTISPLLLQDSLLWVSVSWLSSTLMNRILYIFESSFSGVITFDRQKTTTCKTSVIILSCGWDLEMEEAACFKATEDIWEGTRTRVSVTWRLESFVTPLIESTVRW